MTPKPTLGYASRTDAVIALRASGLSTAAIASKIGIDVSAVSGLECSAARSRQRAPYVADRRFSMGALELSPHQREALRPFAAKRGLSVGALLALILDHIADDKLVDAILDDEGVQY